MARALVLGLLVVGGCGDTFGRGVGLHAITVADTGALGLGGLALEPVVDGLVHPTATAVTPGWTDLWIADQPGQVWHVTPGGTKEVAVDLGALLVPLDPAGDARGLVGLALHPDFPTNGRLFVHLTAPVRPGAPAGTDHTDTLAELVVADDGTVGPPRTILRIDVPAADDVGGALVFDASGALLVAVGEGGGDAQDLSSLLGKVLRLDVDAPGVAYAIPADDPLVGPGGLGRPELWAWGLHDPRGLALDRDDVLVADRGDALQEEVTVLRAGTNAGWPVREGTLCHDPATPTRPPTSCRALGPIGEPLVDPVIALPHPGTAAGDVTVASTIVGGVVVPGDAVPPLAGQLVVGDVAVVPGTPTGRALAAKVRQPGDALQWDPRPVDLGAPAGDLGLFLLAVGSDGTGAPLLLTAAEPGPTGTSGAVWRVVVGGADTF